MIAKLRILVGLAVALTVVSVHAQVNDSLHAPLLRSSDPREAVSAPDTVREKKPLHSSESVASPDSIVVKPHSPRKATLYSMILPGLGQVYNRKYWKVPVIYAGVGALCYMGIQNTSEYKRWHEAYLYKINQDTGGNELADKYDANQLKSQSDYYRRNVELTYILGSLLYILNMVDAAVDAHLFNYDISDQLSLRLNQGVEKPAPFDGSVFSLQQVQTFSLTWRF